MESRTKSDERDAFSVRLCGALKSAGCSLSPSEFSAEFNLRTSGNAVTPYAVRKWLRGESIPTQDKLLVIAAWLQLPPQWLRYGVGSDIRIDSAGNDGKCLLKDDRILLHDIHCLDERARQIVKDLVASLLRNSPRSNHPPEESHAQDELNKPADS